VNVKKVVGLTHRDLIVEAVNAVLKTSGMFTPEVINGKKVSREFAVPINFALGMERITESDKERGLKYIEEGKLGKAYPLLYNYIRFFPIASIAVKEFLNMKLAIGDTLDLEAFKENLGLNDKCQTSGNIVGSIDLHGIGGGISHSKLSNTEEKIYYNEEYEVVGEILGKYYRNTTWNPNISYWEGEFKDYTLDGKLIHSGSYANGAKEGTFKIYDEETTQLIAEGKYKKGKMGRVWRYYYKSGKSKEDIIFMGDDFKVLNYYSESGDTIIKLGTGKWEHTIKSWNGKGDLFISGVFVNGKKEGVWILKDHKDKILAKEHFSAGMFIKGKFYKKRKETESSESLITNWIFANPELKRFEKLIPYNHKVKKYYPFIKFP